MGIVSLHLLTCIVPVTTLRLLNEIFHLINNMLLEFKISIAPYLYGGIGKYYYLSIFMFQK